MHLCRANIVPSTWRASFGTLPFPHPPVLRTLMSPVFGRMSTEHGYRRVLMISTILVTFGALFYAVADGVFQVFLSQVFLGTSKIPRVPESNRADSRV